ncbi:unnamed protein product [Alopecurus aequalis]
MTPQRPPKRHRLHRPAAAACATSSTQTPPTVTLPDDIIFDILSRVPVKAACRFRCVSTEWYSLISDRDFVAAHKSRHHAEPLVAVFSFQAEPSKLGASLQLVDIDGTVVRVIKIKDGGGSRRIMSRHDLICVSDGNSGVCVVDPTTGEVLWTRSRLKVSPDPPSVWRDVHGRTGFRFAFGRSVPSGEYKLVCLVGSQSCQVLNVRDGVGWRPTPPPPTPVECYWTCVVVVNGILHVLASRDMARDIIHCFDLESESWNKIIEGPQKAVGNELWNRTTRSVYIAELKGSLCIVQSQAQVANIWLMTDSKNGDNWVKAYTIPIAPKTYLYKPLGMTHDGGRLLFRCFHYNQAQVVRIYDPCTNTCKDVTKTTTNDGHRISLCKLHLESFISAKIRSAS